MASSPVSAPVRGSSEADDPLVVPGSIVGSGGGAERSGELSEEEPDPEPEPEEPEPEEPVPCGVSLSDGAFVDGAGVVSACASGSEYCSSPALWADAAAGVNASSAAASRGVR